MLKFKQFPFRARATFVHIRTRLLGPAKTTRIKIKDIRLTLRKKKGLFKHKSRIVLPAKRNGFAERPTHIVCNGLNVREDTWRRDKLIDLSFLPAPLLFSLCTAILFASAADHRDLGARGLIISICIWWARHGESCLINCQTKKARAAKSLAAHAIA